jgi:hypothetical protein
MIEDPELQALSDRRKLANAEAIPALLVALHSAWPPADVALGPRPTKVELIVYAHQRDAAITKTHNLVACILVDRPRLDAGDVSWVGEIRELRSELEARARATGRAIFEHRPDQADFDS